MPPLKESNRFNPVTYNKTIDTQEMSNAALHDRLLELEMRNAHLQGLVVELLDKNERLRCAVAQLEKKKN